MDNDHEAGRARRQEEVLAALPVLSGGAGEDSSGDKERVSAARIVDFARIYRRIRKEEVSPEAISELAKELEHAKRARAKENRRVRFQMPMQTPRGSASMGSTAAASGGASTPSGSAVKEFSCVPDQLTLLLTSQDQAKTAEMTKNDPLGTRHNCQGKPLKRYAVYSTPFVTTLPMNTNTWAMRALKQMQEPEEQIYMKVQQIPWENDIVWGFEPNWSRSHSKQSDFQANVIEVDDDTTARNATLKNLPPPPPPPPPLGAARHASFPTAGSASSLHAGRDASFLRNSSATDISRFNASSRVDKPKHLRPTKPSTDDMVYVPQENNGQLEFDITEPRHYRWELDVPEPKKISRASESNDAKDEQQQKLALTCALNRELESNDWLQAIGWNSPKDMPPSRLVLDDNDVSLIFSIPEMEDIRPTLRIPERKLGAAEQRLEQLDKQRREKKQRIDEVMDNLEFGEETAEGRLGTEGGGKKSKDTRVVKNIGIVHHSLPAIKLSLTKPELPKSKLRDFHRPRGRFKINERLVLAPPPVVSLPQKDESALVTQIKKSSDLNPTAGGKLIMIEYTEQNPPMLSNPGMASRILHYWRPPEQDDDVTPTGKKKTKKTKPKPPEMKMGQVITLGDHDDSPFVGDVPPGKTVTSLNSKLFKLPLFQHKPCVPFLANTNASREVGSAPYEIFLACRSVSKKKSALGSDKGTKTTVYVFEIPDLFIAGQVEPQMEVPAPNSRSANDFIRPYMSFHILRLFKKASDGERLKIEDIARAFPNQSGTAIRKRMKEVATFERGGNDSGWWKKKPASQLINEEEIRSSISPESVCLYESMMSGHRRLLDTGLTKLFTPTGVHGAINLMLKRLEFRKQQLSTRLIEPQGLEKKAREKAEKELYNQDPLVRKLEKDIQVARFISEQLQLTPWNLTNNYVECHLQGKGSGMLQLGGIGDPTGRGEGFSFVRVPQSRAKKKEGEEAVDAGPDSAAVQKAVAAVTGTTADLRKLKMKEAGDVLRNLGLAEADIKKLKRWDRIAVVRELSSRATAHGVAGALSKFARGARKSLSAQQQEYRKKCDVIYERQMEVLSADRTSFSSDEEMGDDDDDLDDLEKDLEADMLGGDDTERIAKRGPKNLFSKGGGGLNRSKAVLAEREDAVELRRLMEEMKEDTGTTSNSTANRRPDVDATRLRNQLRASGIKDGSTATSSMAVGGGANSVSRPGSGISSALASPARSRPTSPAPGCMTGGGASAGTTPSRIPGRKAIKKTTRKIEEDGTETVTVEFIVDPQAIARFKALQQRKERQQKHEERNQLRKRKRMLALEDSDAHQSLLTKAKKRKQLQEELKLLQKTEEHNKGYQEMLQKQGEEALDNAAKGGLRCTQCGQVGHMRTNRICPLFMADDLRGRKLTGASKAEQKLLTELEEPLKLRVPKTAVEEAEVKKITVNLSELREGARKHHAEKKRKRMLEIKAQSELYKRPYMNSVVKQSRSRMPVAHLNGNLEIVIYKLLEMPESELFRAPVDANVVKDYYQIIKQPMDLSKIKKKIEDIQYDSMREFIKDLELMVNNSKVYNGDAARNLITANAVKVLKRAQEELASLNAEGGVPISSTAAVSSDKPPTHS